MFKTQTQCFRDYNIFSYYFNFYLQEMAINSYDIVSTLQALGMMKYWKGKHIILKKQVCVLNYLISKLEIFIKKCN